MKSLRKWAPVRTYHRLLPKGVSGKRWRLCLELLCRHRVEQTVASSQRFALLLTIADPERKAPVYDADDSELAVAIPDAKPDFETACGCSRLPGWMKW